MVRNRVPIEYNIKQFSVEFWFRIRFDVKIRAKLRLGLKLVMSLG